MPSRSQRVDPVDIANRLGGRSPPRVASVDFREDMAAAKTSCSAAPTSTQAPQHVSASLATSRLRPPRDAQRSDLMPLDRYMLARTPNSLRKSSPGTRLRFHRVTQAVNESRVVDLSNFYLDVLKDRITPSRPREGAPLRAKPSSGRSPDLSASSPPSSASTADEVWDTARRRGRNPGVHLAQFPKPRVFSGPGESLAEWKTLFLVRTKYEGSRKRAAKIKEIGRDSKQTKGNCRPSLYRLLEKI